MGSLLADFTARAEELSLCSGAEIREGPALGDLWWPPQPPFERLLNGDLYVEILNPWRRAVFARLEDELRYFLGPVMDEGRERIHDGWEVYTELGTVLSVEDGLRLAEQFLDGRSREALTAPHQRKVFGG